MGILYQTESVLTACISLVHEPGRQAVIETIAVVFEHTKRTQEMCSAIGHNNTKHFLCPIRSRHWKWSGESRYPGAFSLVLEIFGRAFRSDPTDCPWVSEDGVSANRRSNNWAQISIFFFDTTLLQVNEELLIRQLIRPLTDQTITRK